MDSLSQRVRDLERLSSRLEGLVEAQIAQLETERDVANRAMTVTQNLLTFGTLFLTAAAVIAGLVGYRDLKGRIGDAVEKELEKTLDAKIGTLGNARLGELERKWDARLADLAARGERLLGGSQ